MGQDKIVKQQTHDLNYFLGENFLDDDVSQKMFVYQPTLDTSEFKKDKNIDYILSWKSKGMYNSKLSYYILLPCRA